MEVRHKCINYADAQVLWLCDVCSIEEIKQEFEALQVPKHQRIFLEEQLLIITAGWGYKDLVFGRHRNNTEPCSVCDSTDADRMQHLLQHTLVRHQPPETSFGIWSSVAPGLSQLRLRAQVAEVAEWGRK